MEPEASVVPLVVIVGEFLAGVAQRLVYLGRAVFEDLDSFVAAVMKAAVATIGVALVAAATAGVVLVAVAMDVLEEVVETVVG